MHCSRCQKEFTEESCPACGRVPFSLLVPPSTSFMDTVGEGQSILETIVPQPEADPNGGGSMRKVSRILRSFGEDGDADVDYQLGEVLGQGAMGIVRSARQRGMEREVAVKQMVESQRWNDDLRRQFLTEAQMTAMLDHPGIVPIHELGTDLEGRLFYSMRRVQGDVWAKKMENFSVEENLEILLRLADTVAYAHSKGVIHRDIKPDNVMLGEYGEVFLMDWGLAITGNDIRKHSIAGVSLAPCGTPAYMAPEMAGGDGVQLGISSDVYLLGGVLYRILTGEPPHVSDSAKGCLIAASENVIDTFKLHGDLGAIALKAMATRPAERYGDVKSFQTAIRSQQTHADSIRLIDNARSHLRKGRKNGHYSNFQRALFGFQEALDVWPESSGAQEGILETKRAYIQSALDKGDLDLAESLLAGSKAEYVDLRSEQEELKAIRSKRDGQLRWFRRISLGLAALTVFGAVGVMLMLQLANEKRIQERRLSAPALVDSARVMLDRGDVENAFTTLKMALDFDDQQSRGFLLQSILLFHSGDLPGAVEAGRIHALTHPDDRDASELLAMFERMQQYGSDAVSMGRIAIILGRLDLPLLASRYVQEAAEKLQFYRQKIAGAWPGMESYLHLLPNGRFAFDLSAAPPEQRRQTLQLSFLEGIPLDRLMIQECPVSDLSSLQHMPLRVLDICNTQVKDLKHLRGLPLEILMARNTPVDDISALRGMPLRELDIAYTGVSNLEPIRGMRLEVLRARGCEIEGGGALLTEPGSPR